MQRSIRILHRFCQQSPGGSDSTVFHEGREEQCGLAMFSMPWVGGALLSRPLCVHGRHSLHNRVKMCLGRTSSRVLRRGFVQAISPGSVPSSMLTRGALVRLVKSLFSKAMPLPREVPSLGGQRVVFESLQQKLVTFEGFMLVSLQPNQINNLRKAHLCNIRHSLCEHPMSYSLMVEAFSKMYYRTDTLFPSPQHQYQSPQTGQ